MNPLHQASPVQGEACVAALFAPPVGARIAHPHPRPTTQLYAMNAPCQSLPCAKGGGTVGDGGVVLRPTMQLYAMNALHCRAGLAAKQPRPTTLPALPCGNATSPYTGEACVAALFAQIRRGAHHASVIPDLQCGCAPHERACDKLAFQRHSEPANKRGRRNLRGRNKAAEAVCTRQTPSGTMLLFSHPFCKKPCNGMRFVI